MKNVAVVTGATKGIGLAICKDLLSRNFVVHGLSLSRKGFEDVAAELVSSSFHWHQCDISDPESIEKVCADISGIVNVLVNNAGYIDTGYRTEQLPLEEWNKLFDVNVDGTFHMIQALFDRMDKEEGTIINVSSNAGKRGVPWISGYSAAKFAVIGLTQALAKENLDTGMRIHALCPGGTNTQMRQKIFGDADKQQCPAVVSSVAMDLIDRSLAAETGDDVVVRAGEVIINKMPL